MKEVTEQVGGSNASLPSDERRAQLECVVRLVARLSAAEFVTSRLSGGERIR